MLTSRSGPPVVNSLGTSASSVTSPVDATRLKMNPLELPSAAEGIRLKIKAMIPELSSQTVGTRAELLRAEKNGNKTYGGDLLGEQISLLSRQLPIRDPQVCVQDFFRMEIEIDL